MSPSLGSGSISVASSDVTLGLKSSFLLDGFVKIVFFLYSGSNSGGTYPDGRTAYNKFDGADVESTRFKYHAEAIGIVTANKNERIIKMNRIDHCSRLKDEVGLKDHRWS